MPKWSQKRVMVRRWSAGHHIDALHDDQEKRQAQVRHEEEMVHGRQGELQPGKLNDIHGHGYFSRPTALSTGRASTYKYSKMRIYGIFSR